MAWAPGSTRTTQNEKDHMRCFISFPIMGVGYSKKKYVRIGTVKTLIVQFCFEEQMGKIHMKGPQNRTGSFSLQIAQINPNYPWRNKWARFFFFNLFFRSKGRRKGQCQVPKTLPIELIGTHKGKIHTEYTQNSTHLVLYK